MDTRRYVLQQAGWDTHSALENYSAIHDPEYRVGGSYGGRGLLEGGFGRETGYARGLFRRDILLEREGFQHPPPVLGLWPPTRRRSLEEELTIIRAQRHEKVGYIDNFREFDNYREVDSFREVDKLRDAGNFRDYETYRDIDDFRDVDALRDYGFERASRFPSRDLDNFEGDDYDYRRRALHGGREESRERVLDHPRHVDYDSDKERGRRDRDWRRQKGKERERRGKSRDRDRSPERDRRRERSRERSRSRSFDDRGRRSRSPRSHSRGKRGDSQEEPRHESRNEKVERKKDRDEKRHQERAPVAPSATLVVKGLSQKTVEDDLCQALTDWGPLRHVRVIKERNTGISRGFAFIDFPSVEAAQKMMDGIGEKGLVVDGRRLFFEYSSKPTGGLGAPQAVPAGSAQGSIFAGTKNGASAAAVDWMCTVCGCVNFARRTLCFQCNEGRAEDAPPADVSAATSAASGKKGSEAGPTHVLVVRGLDEHVNEETLHYEFSKHAPIKDLRLVRDKFTHVSRGFAFVHFHSVEDATKALEASNGTTLEKNGQLLRVAYAKSIHGPGSSSVGTFQSNSLAAAAIEAATFAQQYDVASWAPKEYNLDQETGGAQQGRSGKGDQLQGRFTAGTPQSGFVWDEASGYYYDATSGFYYDGHRGLYYDGNNGIWYSYDQKTQQYVPYVEASGDVPNTENNTADKAAKGSIDGDVEKQLTDRSTDASTKAVISAPPATTQVDHEATEKKPTLAEAVQAAAIAAQAATKKDKEKLKEREKELRLASKSLLLANKKKISNVMTLWKQRQNESQAVPMVIDEGCNQIMFGDDKHETATLSTTSVSGPTSVQTLVGKKLEGVIHLKEKGLGRGTHSLGLSAANSGGGDYHLTESVLKARQTTNGIGNTVIGLGRGAGRGVGRGDPVTSGVVTVQTSTVDSSAVATPFKTDASALGSYGPMAGGRRRFSEAPQSAYRDRAAERRSLYGSSSSSSHDIALDLDVKGMGRGRVLDMPFPPGVGAKATGSVLAGPDVQAYEVITSEKAIDESNVGNRMLRNMGWQEGSGLGKDGSGIVEPVQAQTNEERAGLGSQVQHRKSDSRFETQPGDSYRVVIQKKALARFHEMM